MRSPAVNVALAAAVLVVLAVPQVGVTPAAALPVTTLGETSLLSNSPAPYTSVQNVPTFQGAAGGNYTLSTSVAGTITSWSFLSAGVAAGKHFALRVLRPQTDG